MVAFALVEPFAVLFVVDAMEPSAIRPSSTALVKSTIVPAAASDHMNSFCGLEEEDRRIIETIATKVQQLHGATMFSTKTLPSRIILKFVGIASVSIEDLRLVNISNHRIRDIALGLNQGTMVVELRRLLKTKPTIKKRVETLGLDKGTLRKTVSEFIKTHDNLIRSSDKRVIEAVLECILRWTWKKAAAEVECKRIGDNYHFTVKRLHTVRFQQLETLCDLGEYVQDLKVDLKTKVLSFLVLRASSYIQESQAKRRKHG